MIATTFPLRPKPRLTASASRIASPCTPPCSACLVPFDDEMPMVLLDSTSESAGSHSATPRAMAPSKRREHRGERKDGSPGVALIATHRQRSHLVGRRAASQVARAVFGAPCCDSTAPRPRRRDRQRICRSSPISAHVWFSARVAVGWVARSFDWADGRGRMAGGPIAGGPIASVMPFGTPLYMDNASLDPEDVTND